MQEDRRPRCLLVISIKWSGGLERASPPLAWRTPILPVRSMDLTAIQHDRISVNPDL